MHTRVLLVSDLPGLRRLKRRLLEVAGYEVGEVADGLAALERLRSSPTSLVVVMNTRIPGIDAGGILRAVIAEPALQRHGFVLSTALADMLPDGLGQLTGILQVPIIAKPFTGQGLLAAVALAERQLRGPQLTSA